MLTNVEWKNFVVFIDCPPSKPDWPHRKNPILIIARQKEHVNICEIFLLNFLAKENYLQNLQTIIGNYKKYAIIVKVTTQPGGGIWAFLLFCGICDTTKQQKRPNSPATWAVTRKNYLQVIRDHENWENYTSTDC
jgi:hypothetical protein